MTHTEAQKIIQNSSSAVDFSEDMSNVELRGEFSIEDLHAILQLMEYEA